MVKIAEVLSGINVGSMPEALLTIVRADPFGQDRFVQGQAGTCGAKSFRVTVSKRVMESACRAGIPACASSTPASVNSFVSSTFPPICTPVQLIAD